MGLKLNPITGKLDLVGASSDDNFSYSTIASQKTIPIYQQMVVVDTITLDADIILVGDLAVI